MKEAEKIRPKIFESIIENRLSIRLLLSKVYPAIAERLTNMIDEIRFDRFYFFFQLFQNTEYIYVVFAIPSSISITDLNLNCNRNITKKVPIDSRRGNTSTNTHELYETL